MELHVSTNPGADSGGHRPRYRRAERIAWPLLSTFCRLVDVATPVSEDADEVTAASSLFRETRLSTALDIRYSEMAVIRAIALLACGLAGLFGQTPPVASVAHSDGSGPTFTNQIITSSFPGRHSSIEKVDFRNLKPLRNGRYREDEDNVHYEEQLNKVYFLSSSASKEQAALVLYSWFSAGGSSSQGGVARVFRIVAGTLRSTQRIDWDTHFQAGQAFATLDRAGNTLVIRSAHYLPGDAHCCVSAMDVVTFRWDGNAFVEAALRTELSEYGKKEGKTLPK